MLLSLQVARVAPHSSKVDSGAGLLYLQCARPLVMIRYQQIMESQSHTEDKEESYIPHNPSSSLLLSSNVLSCCSSFFIPWTTNQYLSMDRSDSLLLLSFTVIIPLVASASVLHSLFWRHQLCFLISWYLTVGGSRVNF